MLCIHWDITHFISVYWLQLVEMDKKVNEAESKHNSAVHSLRDKQALCDVKQSQIDVCIFSCDDHCTVCDV